jgi:hypothetical protein
MPSSSACSGDLVIDKRAPQCRVLQFDDGVDVHYLLA